MAEFAEELLFDLHWEGPLEYANAIKGVGVGAHHVFYQIYGSHPAYGSSVLLYIGMTKVGASRIAQHQWWEDWEADPCTVRVASIGRFSTWEHWYSLAKSYPPPSDSAISPQLLEHIEALLITVHQPAYNSSKKNGTYPATPHIRIFNTGRYGALMPELSSLRWAAD